jgi:spore germination protein YaaH
MAYDLYSSIQVPAQYAGIEESQREVDTWITERGVPREKVVCGVPFMGTNGRPAGACRRSSDRASSCGATLWLLLRTSFKPTAPSRS